MNDKDDLLADSIADNNQSPIDELSSIFDDDMISKYSDENGKPRWKCLWCNGTFGGWNATKALAHVTKTKKVDIKTCTSKIDNFHEERYKLLCDKANKK
jgi:hypothetical protein